MNKTKGTFILVMCILFTFAITALNMPIAHASPALNLTVETNKQYYFLREKISIYGNLTMDGSPIQDELMALEVNDIYGPLIYRTLQTGTTPITGDFEIVSIDTYKKIAEFTWVPTDTFEVGSEAWFNVTVKNVGTVTKNAAIASSIYDGNNIPIGAGGVSYSIAPGDSASDFRSKIIPTWAYIGNGTVYASVFTGLPPNGVPYCSEKAATFKIVRAGSGGGSGGGLGTTLSSNNAYNSTFRLSPEPWPGTYQVYVTSSYGVIEITNSTTFQVLDAHSPPQASFTYSPPSPVGENQTVEFDASGSTAEGYGDYIVSYEWDFGDGTPKVKETDPITTHEYTVNGTYIVTLNVTDNEGLWCTTSKPITILEQFGPTVNFTHSPTSPYEGETTMFNASLSQPGFPPYPIANYTWDFDDGTPSVTETDPIINHTFNKYDIYTVQLTVTDTQGRKGIASKPITILQPTGPTANFTYLPPNPHVNGTTIFNASLSQPGQPYPIANYTWDFGDGSALITETDPITTHIYRTEGYYTVTLNVTDTWGLWNTKSQTINVTISTEVHDVAVTNVTRSHGEAFPTWIPPITIQVTVKNLGDFSESFTVTAYHRNTTGDYIIGTQAVTNLAIGANTTLTFQWYLSKVYPTYPPGYPNYTILAEALLPGDTNPENNIFIDGTVRVRPPGDVTGDGHVDINDLIPFTDFWYKSPPNPNADFDNDGIVGILDLIILSDNWYKW